MRTSPYLTGNTGTTCSVSFKPFYYKKGKVAIELLIMLVTIVVTSAIIFLLIQADVIQVKSGNAEVSVLNAEFIPLGREGYLAISDFNFCDYIDQNYGCVGKRNSFSLGSQVHFLFVVESSTYNGDVMVVENYPMLKSNESFNRLMDELAGTENRISVARMRYNQSVQLYNTYIREVIGGFFAKKKD